MKKAVSRRDFLKSAVGLTVAVSVNSLGFKLLGAAELKGGNFQPNAWFVLAPDNSVTVYVPNSEMGQGVRTAFSMLVADELEADWSNIRAEYPPVTKDYNSPLWGIQLTAGSSSVRGYYDVLRKAGAAGRMMLISAAAQTWKVPEGECEARKGMVLHKRSGRKLTYGKLSLKAAQLPVPKEPVLKKESEFNLMGKAMPRLDVPDKVAGTAIYGLDFSVPDMLYAATAKPAVYGAKPVSSDQEAAGKVKGVQKVVPGPNGITVFAETMYAALKGREALHAKWDEGTAPSLDTESVEKHFLEGLDKPGGVAINKGDAKKAVADAQTKFSATYWVPMVAHTLMEPINCTAHVQADRCDIWAPTQGQSIAQMVASQVSGLPADKVFIHTTYIGCGLGRRATPDFVAEAVIASKIAGKPVKIVWSREDEIKYDQFRAPAMHRIEAGLDAEGKVTGWYHKLACGSIGKDMGPDAVKNGVDEFSLWGIKGGGPFMCDTAYDIPNFYVEQYLSDLPIPVSPWRSVQNAPNAFGMECFMDELALKAGKDPIEFRMQFFGNNPRARRVLQTVAEKAGWGQALPKGKGRGIAFHYCFGTFVAQVADVSVNENDGTFKVDRIVAAVDCGPVVNPDPLIAQMEGGIVMGLSTVMKERVEFAKGGVKSSNFDNYKLLTMRDVPKIEVNIIKSSDPIGGIGEPPVPPVAPAVANAIFRATGARVRRIPITPQVLKEAMKNKEA
jgi:isoquinoline 1-oxidoreductase beta subunit